MLRYAPIAAFALAAALATTLAMIHEQPNKASVFLDAPPFDHDVYVSYFCFKNTLNTTVELLANGQLSLADACDRVHESAVRHFPEYFQVVEVTDPAPTPRERIARNLIGHVKRLSEDALALSPRVGTLENELVDLQRTAPRDDLGQWTLDHAAQTRDLEPNLEPSPSVSSTLSGGRLQRNN